MWNNSTWLDFTFTLVLPFVDRRTTPWLLQDHWDEKKIYRCTNTVIDVVQTAALIATSASTKL